MGFTLTLLDSRLEAVVIAPWASDEKLKRIRAYTNCIVRVKIPTIKVMLKERLGAHTQSSWVMAPPNLHV